MSVLALLGVPISFLAEANALAALNLLSTSDIAFSTAQLQAQVLTAAAGYLVDSGAHLLSPGRATISQVTAAGELLLPLWLLLKGVDVERWQQAAATQVAGEAQRAGTFGSSRSKESLDASR